MPVLPLVRCLRVTKQTDLPFFNMSMAESSRSRWDLLNSIGLMRGLTASWWWQNWLPQGLLAPYAPARVLVVISIRTDGLWQTSRQHSTRQLKSEKYGPQNKDKGSAIKVKVKVVAYFLLNLGFAGIIACRRRRRQVEKVKEELRRESWFARSTSGWHVSLEQHWQH